MAGKNIYQAMELLETAAQSHEIEKIFDGSNDFTIIVSPYLKINNRLKPKISDCYNRNSKNLIIYREHKLTKAESDWIGKQNVTLVPVKNLHAKCYLSEKTALITSMNLYDYSQINNHEIGIKISVESNKPEMLQLLRFINSIIKTDYPDYDFSDYYDPLIAEQKYTMSALYADLVNNYEFPDKFKGEDGTYRYICQIAMKLHKFRTEDLKFDGSALKRATPLGHKTYFLLKEELIKKGRRK